MATLMFELDENGVRCAARTLDGLHYDANIFQIRISNGSFAVPRPLPLNLTLKVDVDETGFRCADRTLNGLHLGAKFFKIGEYLMYHLPFHVFDLEFDLEV